MPRIGDLLPIHDTRYDDYSLRKKVRDDVERNAWMMRDAFSTRTSPTTGRHSTDLCRAIDAGDASIGLPPYNGGLFDPEPHAAS